MQAQKAPARLIGAVRNTVNMVSSGQLVDRQTSMYVAGEYCLCPTTTAHSALNLLTRSRRVAGRVTKTVTVTCHFRRTLARILELRRSACSIRFF